VTFLNSEQHPEPLALSGRRLTRLLARWADAHRLDDRRAAAIRQNVLDSSTPRDFEWWWRLLAPRLLAPNEGAAFRGFAGSARWSALPRASVLAAEPPIGFLAGISGRTAWSEDDAEYQPYLRLT
jgi:hypothetical protein